ncbi:MAG: hypothetical protein LBR10_04720 [Prevotellaceae bacterium]|jgi:uncharacterized membrane protein|nr:hypothetical protein [Prevotellaceae bacterium]
MARHQQNTKGIATKHQVAIEQHTVVDDSLLPPAEELLKLKEIDPNIINWMLSRAEKEQDSRLSFNTERIKLAKSEHGLVKLSLILAFVLAISGMILSAVFIYFGKEITGTIFGGASMIMCIQSFLKFGRKEKQ